MIARDQRVIAAISVESQPMRQCKSRRMSNDVAVNNATIGAHLGREIFEGVTDGAEDTRRRAESSRTKYFVLAVAAVFALLQGCSSPVRQAAVPKEQEDAAVVGGMTGIRYWKQA
ncbi:MAG TPA: hypothetical protein VJ924_09065, partial [Alphaproteobacteria bacterium]|nr:hypothetical protein [Alphaproteobacteria bacterium]